VPTPHNAATHSTVGRGAQPARRDQCPGAAVDGAAERVEERRAIVAHHRDADERGAEGGQLLGQPVAVRVLDAPEQEFSADAEDLDRRGRYIRRGVRRNVHTDRPSTERARPASAPCPHGAARPAACQPAPPHLVERECVSRHREAHTGAPSRTL